LETRLITKRGFALDRLVTGRLLGRMSHGFDYELCYPKGTVSGKLKNMLVAVADGMDPFALHGDCACVWIDKKGGHLLGLHHGVTDIGGQQVFLATPLQTALDKLGCTL